MELWHHGIKGQKWGVRRYQNKDGTMTELGKRRYYASRNAKTKKDVDYIVSHMTENDRRQLGLKPNEEYLSIEQGEWVVKRFLLKYENTPVAFFDIFGNGETANIALGVKSDSQGKGYGSEITRRGMKYINEHMKEYSHIEWNALENNAASRRLAEKSGFEPWVGMDYENDLGKFKSYIKRMNVR